MCGIAGFVSDILNKENLEQMTDCLSHRGPDAQGYFLEKNIGLGHRRLSIIDLSDAANQPMFSNDGEWVLIFNGEIYNYNELRQKLIQQGHSFTTHSDTEVVIRLFQLYGPDAVQSFIGMFAFAIYHRQTETLYVFRDRVGVKPFYYYWQNGEFYFASELKALIPQLPNKEINHQALGDFFRFGYIRSPDSIFKNVYKLQPGHYAVIKNKELEIKKYWSIEDVCKNEELGEGEATKKLEDLMQSSFNYRMVADVPVGVFLSGGIDSSSLTALLTRTHSNLKTFSIGFDDEWYNEAPYAKKIASFLGTDHHERILTGSDAEKVMDKYFSIYDEPFADSSGIPVYIISEFARNNGCKVVLSADGGDELFGGYDRYRSMPNLYSRIQTAAKFKKLVNPTLSFLTQLPFHAFNINHKAAKLRDMIAAINKYNRSEFYINYLSIISKENLEALTGNHYPFEAALKAESIEEEMMLWDFRYYLTEDLLTKVDRASMATSIEAREPFLDHRLVEFVFSLPLSYRLKPECSKYLLKKILFKKIPPEYFDRRKMGFSIPLFKWFSQKLDKEFIEIFNEQSLSPVNVLNKQAVIKEYKRYLSFKGNGKEHNILLIWHLYVFVKWWQRWMN